MNIPVGVIAIRRGTVAVPFLIPILVAIIRLRRFHFDLPPSVT
jgi:hypothetical protein